MGLPELSSFEPLTESEVATLRLVAQGVENQEIAQVLNYFVYTVVSRLRTIYEKLHVADRTQAALYACARAGPFWTSRWRRIAWRSLFAHRLPSQLQIIHSKGVPEARPLSLDDQASTMLGQSQTLSSWFWKFVLDRGR